MGKSKERQAKEALWSQKIRRIIDLAHSRALVYRLEWGLDVLATAIAAAESLIARSQFLVAELRMEAKDWMIRKGIERSRRKGSCTMLRLDPVLKFEQGPEGRRQKRAIAKRLKLSREQADRLVVESRKVQPRRVIISLKLDNDVLRELDPDGTKTKLINTILGNPPQLYVGPRTKTDKAGKPPRRRQGH